MDPPWNQGKTGRRSVRPNQTTALDYPTLSKHELCALPIADWGHAPQSFLWLWATNSKDRSSGEPILRMAFDLLAHWGYTYYTTITWNKRTGPCPFGPYQIITEHILFGYRGRCTFAPGSLGQLQTLFTAPPAAHSVKPDACYRAIATHFAGPRLDVFARQARAGFDAWGNETGTLAVDGQRARTLAAA